MIVTVASSRDLPNSVLGDTTKNLEAKSKLWRQMRLQSVSLPKTVLEQLGKNVVVYYFTSYICDTMKELSRRNPSCFALNWPWVCHWDASHDLEASGYYPKIQEMSNDSKFSTKHLFTKNQNNVRFLAANSFTVCGAVQFVCSLFKAD